MATSPASILGTDWRRVVVKDSWFAGMLDLLFMTATRTTLVWVGARLADLPSLGLPAVSWLQVAGIVLMVRGTLTYVIGVSQINLQEKEKA
jgi:hypothetical protein